MPNFAVTEQIKTYFDGDGEPRDESWDNVILEMLGVLVNKAVVLVHH